MIGTCECSNTLKKNIELEHMVFGAMLWQGIKKCLIDKLERMNGPCLMGVSSCSPFIINDLDDLGLLIIRSWMSVYGGCRGNLGRYRQVNQISRQGYKMKKMFSC